MRKLSISLTLEINETFILTNEEQNIFILKNNSFHKKLKNMKGCRYFINKNIFIKLIHSIVDNDFDSWSNAWKDCFVDIVSRHTLTRKMKQTLHLNIDEKAFIPYKGLWWKVLFFQKKSINNLQKNALKFVDNIEKNDKFCFLCKIKNSNQSFFFDFRCDD